MSGIVTVPSNVSAITLGDGAHSPSNNQLTDSSDADITTLVESFNQPHIVVAALNGQVTISMPKNVTSITINSIVYTPDGSQYNTITGPDADFTPVVEQGFTLVDELT